MSESTDQELQRLEHIRQDIMATRERALTAKQVETGIWDLWNTVELNRDSLRAEHCIEKIRQLLADSVQLIQLRLESTVRDLRAARKKGSELRAQVKTLERVVQTSEERIKVLENRMKKAVAQQKAKTQEAKDKLQVKPKGYVASPLSDKIAAMKEAEPVAEPTP